MKRTTLIRRTPPPTRQRPLRRQSVAGARQAAAQRRAYDAAPDAGQGWCSVCGAIGETDHSHLFSQKAYPRHRNNHLNWLRMCRGCHDLFEHQKHAFASHYPTAWQQILGRMQQLDSVAYEQFRLKNPY